MLVKFGLVLQQTNHGHIHARVHKKYIAQVPTTQRLNPEDSLFKADPKQYREKVKFAKETDDKPEILAAAIKLLQQNIGTLLFYRRAVDMTLLVALSTIS